MVVVFSKLGLTRDSVVWFWGKVVSLATLVTSGLFNPQFGMFDPAKLGLSGRTVLWLQFVAVVVLYTSGQMSSSKLPGKLSPVGEESRAKEGLDGTNE